MHNLIRLAVWMFLLLVFFASIGFSFLNTTPVSLSFGIVEFAAQPVALWIVASFALGGLLGLLIGAGLRRLWATKSEVRQLQKQLDTANRRVEEQRGMPLEDLE